MIWIEQCISFHSRTWNLKFGRKTRKIRTERLTERLDELVPWSEFLDLIRPFYFETGRPGRQLRTRAA